MKTKRYCTQCLAKRSSVLRVKAAELARADCKARKGGSKLRLAFCSVAFCSVPTIGRIMLCKLSNLV